MKTLEKCSKLNESSTCEKAKQARDKMKTDKIKATDEAYCYTFDLQTAISFLTISTYIDYHKLNLHVNNFGMHSLNNIV